MDRGVQEGTKRRRGVFGPRAHSYGCAKQVAIFMKETGLTSRFRASTPYILEYRGDLLMYHVHLDWKSQPADRLSVAEGHRGG